MISLIVNKYSLNLNLNEISRMNDLQKFNLIFEIALKYEIEFD